MKRKVFVMILLASLFWPVAAEGYNDIVVYIVPRHAQKQLLNFQSSIQCNGSYLGKLNNGNWCLIVKSKGYGLDMYEYKIYEIISKQVYAAYSSDWRYYNNFLQ